MATPPFCAPGDKIIITIAGAQLHHRANKLRSLCDKKPQRRCGNNNCLQTARRTDGQTDNGVSHKLDWSRPVELIKMTKGWNSYHC